jgi:hypothetical protein
MWRAMHKVWERARVESGGHPLNLPLVGSGLSGLGLPTRDLLNLIVLSAITETKASEVIRQGHWAIVDLVGKDGHVRTVPMPVAPGAQRIIAKSLIPDFHPDRGADHRY